MISIIYVTSIRRKAVLAPSNTDRSQTSASSSSGDDEMDTLDGAQTLAVLWLCCLLLMFALEEDFRQYENAMLELLILGRQVHALLHPVPDIPLLQ